MNRTKNLLLFLILGTLIAIAVILNEGLVVAREFSGKPTEIHLEAKGDRIGLSLALDVSTLKDEMEVVKKVIGWGPAGLPESLAAPGRKK